MKSIILVLFFCSFLIATLTRAQSDSPTFSPSSSPVPNPTRWPTLVPTTGFPSVSYSPSKVPTRKPTAPTRTPTRKPTGRPTAAKFWYKTTVNLFLRSIGSLFYLCFCSFIIRKMKQTSTFHSQLSLVSLVHCYGVFSSITN